jgi:enamine deaminase RidA (YjgF/YER057c/UK114 family)
MRKLLSYGPRLKLSGLFLAGLLCGMWLQAWSSPGAAGAGAAATSGGPEDRLQKLNLELPPITKPTNTLLNAVRVGDLLFVSGTGPNKGVAGRLGEDLDTEKGRAVARQVGLHILSVVKAELGSLDKVQRLIRTFGMVNAKPDFKQHPQVINGFSDLMVEVFGEEAGKGARCAVGMGSLPNGIPVEIEAIFQVRR